MAICTVKLCNHLDEGYVLAPERYHPGRNLKFNTESAISLGEIVSISNELFTVKDFKLNPSKKYLINTGDTYEGRIDGFKKYEEKINSTKKILKPGDVIISRLRPYLKQIAYVDDIFEENNILYLSSTEFFVLRSLKADVSISFLVPFLLSEPVQKVLNNSVEGSQHPRFKEEVLMNLQIPEKVISKKDILSIKVLDSLKKYREYEREIMQYKKIINRNITESL